MYNLPVLYSFRRCPYAMRARLGLYEADLRFEWREILLRDKPKAFLAASDDATVPVLVYGDAKIQESLDILLWALKQNDPNGLLERYNPDLVAANDDEFKPALDKYKYASRFEDGVGDFAREEATIFLYALDDQLDGQDYLHGAQIGASDIAVLPFVRHANNPAMESGRAALALRACGGRRAWRVELGKGYCQRLVTVWQTGIQALAARALSVRARRAPIVRTPLLASRRRSHSWRQTISRPSLTILPITNSPNQNPLLNPEYIRITH